MSDYKDERDEYLRRFNKLDADEKRLHMKIAFGCYFWHAMHGKSAPDIAEWFDSMDDEQKRLVWESVYRYREALLAFEDEEKRIDAIAGELLDQIWGDDEKA